MFQVGTSSALVAAIMTTTQATKSQDNIVALLVDELMLTSDPTMSVVWDEAGDDPINCYEVDDAIDQGKLLSVSYTPSEQVWSRQDHIARIAYLVVHGWSDPIHINMDAEWAIVDGNHRFFCSNCAW